jgi:hypothetical protein
MSYNPLRVCSLFAGNTRSTSATVNPACPQKNQQSSGVERSPNLIR